MTQTDAQIAWKKLDEWLRNNFVGYLNHVDQVDIPGAGRGLVATSSHKSGEPLLVIPSGALLNPLTLLADPGCTIPQHLFPLPTHSSAHRDKRRRTSISQKSLNTTQLLTLHVLLTRDPMKRHESKWAVYLDTVPQDFDFHPVVWAVKGEKRLTQAPAAARAAVDKVKERFVLDLAVLQGVLATEEPFKSQLVKLSIDDYLWAWLIVNTRSVSIPLGFAGPTELYNHTLVPILDLANHSSQPSILKPRQTACPSRKSSQNIGRPISYGQRIYGPGLGGSQTHLIPGKTAFQLLSSKGGLEKGEELTFEYHGLGNTDMWAEYGFAEAPLLPKSPTSTPLSASSSKQSSSSGSPYESASTPDSPQYLDIDKWSSMKYSTVQVDHLVTSLWASDSEKEEALRRIDCWNHNTLHPYPTYEASRGLLMTLRVLHLRDHERGRLGAIGAGRVVFVSEENERLVRRDLVAICAKLLDEVEDRRRVKREIGSGLKEDEEGMIGVLWDEQDSVARGCLAVYS